MKQDLFNINIDVLSRQEVFEACLKFLKSGTTHSIFFLNAHCYNIACKNSAYSESLQHSDLVLNDGTGINLASKFKGIRLKENLNGTDLIPEILELCAREGERVFLLGGKEGIAQMAANNLIPDIHLSGHRSGYFKESDEEEIIEGINGSGASVLIIGMGVPRQELFVERNRARFKNIRILIAGGAILDFLSGNVPRAPRWMRRYGLEWVYRFYLEPRRMWKRYLLGNILFFYNLLLSHKLNKSNF